MVTPTIIEIPASPPGPAGTNGAPRPPEYDRENDPAYLQIAYPPNEEPMADPIRLRDHLLALLVPLVAFFEGVEDAFVFHTVFMYYRLRGIVRAIAPDLMITLSANLEFISVSESYHMWAAGKPPEFVMEIGSNSTARRDIVEKRVIYARIGAREYWLFDPPDGSRYGFILKGLRLVNGEYVEIPMIEGPGDNIRGYSEVLGLDICWENDGIRFYDPEAGEYLKNHTDTAAALVAEIAARETDREFAQAAIAAAEVARAIVEADLAAETAARETAEANLAAETAAREAAESSRETAETARKAAEAEVRRLRAMLDDQP